MKLRWRKDADNGGAASATAQSGRCPGAKRPWRVGVFSLTLCALMTLPCRVTHAQTKKVFAHYMVALRTYGGGLDGYKRDIQEAQAIGVDGFALNCGDWNGGNYKTDTATIFQAAQELGTGFELFFSADLSTGLSDAEIRDMMTAYANHPNYFKYNSRPVLSTFGGDGQSGGGTGARDWWNNNVLTPLRNAGYNVYFVPYFYTSPVSETPDYNTVLGSYNAWWKDVIDGHFYFGAAGLPSYSAPSLLSAGEAEAKVLHDNGRPFMASVTPQYWGEKQTPGRRYFEFQGGEGIAAQFQSIRNNQNPEWIELVTWNDFTEATYFSPCDDVNKYWPYSDTQHTELGFFKSHAGAAQLAKYYIDWYKNYAPTQAPPPPGYVDNLYWFYRTHKASATANGDPKGPVSGRIGPVADNIYVTTILINPATLKVITGGVTKSYAVPNGITHTKIPFNTGSQYFELWRNGTRLLRSQGDSIKSSISSYNFIYTTGWAHD